MEPISLKHPLGTYPKRFNRFLWLVVAVKDLQPRNHHLWKVMDSVAFQDTETALEVELFNHGRAVDIEEAERLTVEILNYDRRIRASRRKAATA
jgi:hypothetical protein